MKTSQRSPELRNIYLNSSNSYVVRIIRMRNNKKIIDKSRSFNTPKIGSTKKAKVAAMQHRDKLRKMYPGFKRSKVKASRRAANHNSYAAGIQDFLKRRMQAGQSRAEAMQDLAALLGRSK